MRGGDKRAFTPRKINLKDPKGRNNNTDREQENAQDFYKFNYVQHLIQSYQFHPELCKISAENWKHLVMDRPSNNYLGFSL